MTNANGMPDSQDPDRDRERQQYRAHTITGRQKVSS